MARSSALIRWTVGVALACAMVTGVRADDPPAGSGAGSGATEKPKSDDGVKTPEKVDETPLDPQEAMIVSLSKQIEQMKTEIADLRRQLAEVTLHRDQSARELEELRQFIRDHREYGSDFAQYQEIKEITRQTERRRAAEELRARQEEQRQRRLAQRAAQDPLSALERAERERIEQYGRAGFQLLGLDVFLGRTGYFYNAIESGPGVRVEYEPFIGRFLTPTSPSSRIDYSKMTISGTVLSAADEVRNIGIALAFFDARGNQIGSETVIIRNARPNVPYPFTSTIDMASNAAFATSTSWVLFADPAADE